MSGVGVVDFCACGARFGRSSAGHSLEGKTRKSRHAACTVLKSPRMLWAIRLGGQPVNIQQDRNCPQLFLLILVWSPGGLSPTQARETFFALTAPAPHLLGTRSTGTSGIFPPSHLFLWSLLVSLLS